MKKIKVLAICAIAVFSVTSAKAQFSTGADIVSSYVWRGIDQAGGITPNIQPYASFTAGKFTIGSWASSSFVGNLKEVDLYATYAFSSSLALTVTDYNWTFANPKGYFSYGKGTDHLFEGTLAYTGAETFPLSASVNVIFAGADTLATGKNAFSTYGELSYLVSPNAKVFLGASLLESPVYATTGFGITNVGIKVSKSIAITDKFSLPVYGIVGANPYAGKVFFVAGITL
ncbi:MAG TPA: hypothetical protein VFK73_01570 [Paludibacter sp.]|jgi:hypothetical protein|nr:hypothetical protein [Paludibacter sp.]